MTGNQCGLSSYTKISRRTIKFKDISRISRMFLNSSRFPGFPGVVDTLMPASHYSVFYRPDALPAAQPTV